MGERRYYSAPKPDPCRPLIEVVHTAAAYVVCFRASGTAHSQPHQTFESACKEAKILADFFGVGFTYCTK